MANELTEFNGSFGFKILSKRFSQKCFLGRPVSGFSEEKPSRILLSNHFFFQICHIINQLKIWLWFLTIGVYPHRSVMDENDCKRKFLLKTFSLKYIVGDIWLIYIVALLPLPSTTTQVFSFYSCFTFCYSKIFIFFVLIRANKTRQFLIQANAASKVTFFWSIFALFLNQKIENSKKNEKPFLIWKLFK